MLFMAVEHEGNSPIPLRTNLSLQDVAMILFERDSGRVACCGNAGNDAFYNLQVYIQLVAGRTLDELRSDLKAFREAPLQMSETAEFSAVDEIGPLKTRPDDELLVTPGADEDDDEDDSEDDMSNIKGAYYEDKNGEMVVLDDD